MISSRYQTPDIKNMLNFICKLFNKKCELGKKFEILNAQTWLAYCNSHYTKHKYILICSLFKICNIFVNYIT
jgi:hypothetical protein